LDAFAVVVGPSTARHDSAFTLLTRLLSSWTEGGPQDGDPASEMEMSNPPATA
jgi:hypothetical protein